MLILALDYSSWVIRVCVCDHTHWTLTHQGLVDVELFLTLLPGRQCGVFDPVVLRVSSSQLTVSQSHTTSEENTQLSFISIWGCHRDGTTHAQGAREECTFDPLPSDFHQEEYKASWSAQKAPPNIKTDHRRSSKELRSFNFLMSCGMYPKSLFYFPGFLICPMASFVN